MLDIFSGLRLVVRRRVVNIDNAIFRCHWFFTSTLLVSFSLIITARQYVGQPIECHSVDKIPDSLLNSYCWVQSTFNVPQACTGQSGVDVPYPCIDNTRGREIKVYAYYQWVGMVLFIQGLMFHLPYYLWKLWENGLIKAITGGLRVAVLNEHERAKKKEIVVEYIHDHLGCHRRYALKYFLCEFICLVNLLGQLWATNKFFDGQFMRYGLEVLEYSSSSISGQFNSMQLISSTQQQQQQLPLGSKVNITTQADLSRLFPSQQAASTLPQTIDIQNNKPANHLRQQPTIKQQVDPMTLIFPRMSKCRYHDFGSSGDVQTHDALCILPLNIINEKIYIALWFWFFILAILTLIVIIYRLFAIVSENVRCKGLISRCKLSSERDIRLICRHCDVGDWFLFYMVAENVDPLIMREIVASIAIKITNQLQLKEELKVQLEHSTEELDRDKLSFVEQLCRQPEVEFNGPSLVGESSRRSSNTEQVPLIRKLKKRLYNKRLWSIDLGSSDLRQQLFGCTQTEEAINGIDTTDTTFCSNSSRQQATTMASSTSGHSTATTSNSIQFASAPPVSEMPLNGAPPARRPLHRRASLTRQASTSSTSGVSSRESSSGSFVMEMIDVGCVDSLSRQETKSRLRLARWTRSERPAHHEHHP